jgi:hypothetical protein
MPRASVFEDILGLVRAHEDQYRWLRIDRTGATVQVEQDDRGLID